MVGLSQGGVRPCGVPLRALGPLFLAPGATNPLLAAPSGRQCNKPARIKHLTRVASPEQQSVPQMAGNSDQLCQLSVAVFSAGVYVKDFLSGPLGAAFTKVKYIEARLNTETASLARGYDAVCLFVNDDADAEVLEELSQGGVRFVAMRCAGYDRVDLGAAKRLGMKVVRVPTYSPRSVAEFALALLFELARNLPTAHLKVLVGNYTSEGLVGWQLSGKTYGVVGTGNIGIEFMKLLKGFGGRILAYDVRESPEALAEGAEYVDLETLLRESDFVSLHCPLLPSTFHIINEERLSLMKPTAMLINVSRGGLIDTDALIKVVESGKLAGVGMDVYEHEGPLFFNDLTQYAAQERMEWWDNKFSLLKSLPHVLVTPHIAFLTREALGNIADTTVTNLLACASGAELVNEVKARD